MWVQLPPGANLKDPAFLRGFKFMPEHTHCWVCGRQLKGAAMYEFACELVSRKASTASPACRKTPSGVLPEGESAHQLLGVRRN